MDGQAVFKLAVSVLADVARKTVEAAGLTIADVDWLIPHQANVRIMTRRQEPRSCRVAKRWCTVHRHANTSAASIPLALAEAVPDGRVQPGTGAAAGVGGGFTWGAEPGPVLRRSKR